MVKEDFKVLQEFKDQADPDTVQEDLQDLIIILLQKVLNSLIFMLVVLESVKFFEDSVSLVLRDQL